MNESLKFYAFIFLAVRVLIDLVTSIVLYYQTGALVVGIGAFLGCSVFSVFLYFGLKNEEFRGRRGQRVDSSEPFAYWFVVAFLVISHLIVTALMINIIRWR